MRVDLGIIMVGVAPLHVIVEHIINTSGQHQQDHKYFKDVFYRKYANSPEDDDYRPQPPQVVPIEVDKVKVFEREENPECDQDNSPKDVSKFHDFGFLWF